MSKLNEEELTLYKWIASHFIEQCHPLTLQEPVMAREVNRVAMNQGLKANYSMSELILLLKQLEKKAQILEFWVNPLGDAFFIQLFTHDLKHQLKIQGSQLE